MGKVIMLALAIAVSAPVCARADDLNEYINRQMDRLDREDQELARQQEESDRQEQLDLQRQQLDEQRHTNELLEQQRRKWDRCMRQSSNRNLCFY